MLFFLFMYYILFSFLFRGHTFFYDDDDDDDGALDVSPQLGH